ncbi:MAG: ribonuclease H [Myxococcota bacterium]
MDVPDTPPSRGEARVRGDVEVVAWTDGGSRTNPGPSGWGVVLVHLGTGGTLTMRGGEPVATNNRMELTAIAEALSALKRRTRVEIRTDSRFAISVCEDWRHGWKRRGWMRASGEPPVNLDVIQRLDGLVDRHDVRFTWVPGHSGEPGNERADALCNEAIDAVLANRDPSLNERSDRAPFTIEVE